VGDACAPEAFEALYRSREDPWDFATAPSEQRRYDVLETMLARPRYSSGYEPGCSVGVLTRRLAARCDRLRAIDVSPTAVARARRRCREQPGVTIEVGSLASDATGGHDLVVLSEIGYYFEGAALTAALDRVIGALRPGGTLAACHWTAFSPDHPIRGQVVHAHLHLRWDLIPVAHHREPHHVLDLWERR